MEETEVAHSAGGRADVERVARIDEDDAQAVELGLGRQQNGDFLFEFKDGVTMCCN